MTRISAEHAASLDRAGIFKIFHDKTLADYGNLGSGYAAWVKKNGPRLKRDGGLVIFIGLGQHNELRMVAKTFHMNGAGVRVKGLTHLVRTLDRGGEKMEEMNDAPTLFVSPAQGSRMLSPLNPWQTEDVLSYMKERIERGQIVLLEWASDHPLTNDDPMYQWWPSEAVRWFRDTATLVQKTEIEQAGAKLAKDTL